MPTLQAQGILLAFLSHVLFQTISVSGQTEVKRNYLANLKIRYDAYSSNRPVSDIFPAPIRLTSNIDYRAIPATPGDPKGRDPKIHMTVPKLITSAGYGYKSYSVNTSDGYILTMFRVFRIDCMVNRSHTPVLMQHGFLGSAADWFLQDGDKALPFMLANNGFDVWVGNARGNEYSMGHKTLDSGNPFGQFWNFSFHEMGTRDLPAMIDFILNKVNDREENKNKTAINYVGHGLGTTMMYVCLAEYPCKYNKKVQTLVSLAPQALLSRTQAVFARKLAKFLQHQRGFGTVGRLGASDLNALSRLVVPID